MKLTLHIVVFILVFIGARHLILARETQLASRRNDEQQCPSEPLEAEAAEKSDELPTQERIASDMEVPPQVPMRPKPSGAEPLEIRPG